MTYGVVHLLVGWLALQLAFGDKEDQASNSGAMHYLAQQPLGGFLVWVIAIGMLFLVVWRLLEFAFGYPRGVRRQEALAQARDLARQGDHLRRDRLQRVQDRHRRRRRQGRHRLDDGEDHGAARAAS